MDVKKLFEVVKEVTNKSKEDILAKKKGDLVNYARYYMIALLQKYGYEDDQIAIVIERHRTAVIHGLKRHQELLPYDDYNSNFNKIVSILELSKDDLLTKLKKDLKDKVYDMQRDINNFKCKIDKL